MQLCLFVLLLCQLGQSKINFPEFVIPPLTEVTRDILAEKNVGKTFLTLWDSTSKNSVNVQIKRDENAKVTLLVPKDEAFSKVANEAGLPDLFLIDFQLAQRVVTNHIITQFSIVPDLIKPGLELNATSSSFKKLQFFRQDDGLLLVNGHPIQLVYEDPKLTVFELEELLIDSEYLEERLRRKVNLADRLPSLEPRMSFGLRRVGAHLFGTIWRQSKHELQKLKAKETSNSCYLPKEVGPCRGLDARFFFNADSGTCEPFAYGGCDGNANNFQTLRQCAEACVKEKDELDRIKSQICRLPINRFEEEGQRRSGRSGPCPAKNEASSNETKKYHYEDSIQSCVPVEFSGCFGTDNLFDSESECTDFCSKVQTEYEDIEDDLAIDTKLESMKLMIFAPNDLSLEEALVNAGIEDNLAFARDPELGFNFVMRLMSNESCGDGKDEISSLSGEVINCKEMAMLASGSQLNGFDYTVIVLDELPFSLDDIMTPGKDYFPLVL